MKKIFTLFTLAMFLCSAMQAQMKKNDLLLGGSLRFNQSDKKTEGQEKLRAIGVSVYPSIGIFYRENRMWGFNLSYSYYSSDENNYKNNSYGAGVFLRQYKALGKSWYFFLEESLNTQIGKEKIRDYLGLSETRTFQTSLAAYPGIAYAASHRLQLEISLTNVITASYTTQKNSYLDNSNTEDKTTHGFYANTGLSGGALSNLGFGMKWLLAARK